MNALQPMPQEAVAVEPLSDLHEALQHIGRERHPHRLNRFANDPSIADQIRGYSKGRLDLSGAVADPNNVLLTGSYGAIIFKQHQPGFYEGHSMALPEGRGKWMLSFTRACIHWMMTRTDMVDAVTRCPQGNIAALALTKRIGGKLWFHRENGWIKDNDPIPADIYRLSIDDWMDTAPGLVERGRWFRKRFAAELKRLGKEYPEVDDPMYDRSVGFACEAALGGNLGKAIIFFNRFAAIAGYLPINIVGFNPPSLNIGGAILVIRDTDFWVASA